MRKLPCDVDSAVTSAFVFLWAMCGTVGAFVGLWMGVKLLYMLLP